jgi:AcrR family transcriptional regulator
MPRPSRNLDLALIAAGRELLPHTGCGGLTIRQVADAAGVNIGMFHYHFRTREAFLRAVLQDTYESMFARLTLEAARPRGAGPVEPLRAALRVLGRFVRDHRQFIGRVLADALSGEAISREFLGANLTRHVGVVAGLIRQAQAEGALRALAVHQAVGLCAGAVAFPILAGGAVAESGVLGKGAARELSAALLTDAAIDQRIELALAALAATGRGARARKGRP